MRPAQFWVYVTLYVSTITLILLINYMLYIKQAAFESLVDLFSSLYTQLLIVEAMMLLIWSAFNSASTRARIAESPLQAFSRKAGRSSFGRFTASWKSCLMRA